MRFKVRVMGVPTKDSSGSTCQKLQGTREVTWLLIENGKVSMISMSYISGLPESKKRREKNKTKKKDLSKSDPKV